MQSQLFNFYLVSNLSSVNRGAANQKINHKKKKKKVGFEVWGFLKGLGWGYFFGFFGFLVGFLFCFCFPAPPPLISSSAFTEKEK